MKALQRFADRHGRIIAGLALLAYAAYLYGRTSIAALMTAVLLMVFAWGALASATDLPGAPLRKNRRVMIALLCVGGFGLLMVVGLLVTGSTRLF